PITAKEARIDSAVMAPGRPGGASRKPASSAVATGVTVSTATVISSNVGSHAPAPTRGHESPRTRLRPVATAMRESPYRGEPPNHRGEAPEERHGCAGASERRGYGGAMSGPQYVTRSRGAPRLRRGASERRGVWGAMSGPPISIIKQLRSDDP